MGDREHDWPTRTLRTVKKGERIVLRTGAVLFGLGLLFLAFVAYQLWDRALQITCAEPLTRRTVDATASLAPSLRRNHKC